jgi:hypothetical protein
MGWEMTGVAHWDRKLALAIVIAACTVLLPDGAAAVTPIGEPHEVWIKSYNPRYKVFGFRAEAIDERKSTAFRPFVVAWEADNVADENEEQRPDTSILRIFGFVGPDISETSPPYPLRTSGYTGADQPKVVALAKLHWGDVLAVTERVKHTTHGTAKRIVAGQHVDYHEHGASFSTPLTKRLSAEQAVTSFAVGLARGGAIFAYYKGAASSSKPTSVPARKISREFSKGPLDKDIALDVAAAPEQLETLPVGFLGLFRQYGPAQRMHLQRYDDAARKIGASVSIEASATASYDVVPLADGRIVLFELGAGEAGGSQIRYWLFSAKLAPLAPVEVLKSTDTALLDVKVTPLLGGGFLILESAASAGHTLNAVSRYTDAFEKKGAIWTFKALDKVDLVDLGKGRAIVALKEPKGKNRLVVQGIGY